MYGGLYPGCRPPAAWPSMRDTPSSARVSVGLETSVLDDGHCSVKWRPGDFGGGQDSECQSNSAYDEHLPSGAPTVDQPARRPDAETDLSQGQRASRHRSEVLRFDLNFARESSYVVFLPWEGRDHPGHYAGDLQLCGAEFSFR